jgi:hypothetical protein
MLIDHARSLPRSPLAPRATLASGEVHLSPAGARANARLSRRRSASPTPNSHALVIGAIEHVKPAARDAA